MTPNPSTADTFHPGPALPGQLDLDFSRSNFDACSLVAFESIKPHVNMLQALVLEAIRLSDSGGLTCDDVEAILGMSHPTTSVRILELRRKGLIYRTGEKRPTRSGRPAHVYRVKGI